VESDSHRAGRAVCGHRGTAFHTASFWSGWRSTGADRPGDQRRGIPQKSEVLNRVYANVLNKPVLVPRGFRPAWARESLPWWRRAYKTIEEAQRRFACPCARWNGPKAARCMSSCTNFTATCILLWASQCGAGGAGRVCRSCAGLRRGAEAGNDYGFSGLGGLPTSRSQMQGPGHLNWIELS